MPTDNPMPTREKMQQAVKILAAITGVLAASVLVFAVGMMALVFLAMHTVPPGADPMTDLGFFVAGVLAAPPLVAALLAGTGFRIRARYTLIALVLTIVGLLVAALPALLLAQLGLNMVWDAVG